MLIYLILSYLNAYLSYQGSLVVRFKPLRQNGINSFKRHSDGTFTNDYTHYLDKIKAKDFIQWLASTKREK
uniref:Glucagon / GIP / secretin / VIP family domain-containing protein n=1 Tax=Oncorhynchus tshawytscha TaxID=74940 RepID=A0A8C8DCD2_ONCTS